MLQPFLEQRQNDASWQSEKQCSKVLCQVRQWSEIKKGSDLDSLIIEGNDARGKLGRLVGIPTNKGCFPAAFCYAGEDWGGSSSFEVYLEQSDNRYLVSPFKEWPAETKELCGKEEWKWVLRSLGVSWETKLSWHDWGDNGLNQSPLIMGYKEYCRKRAQLTPRHIYGGRTFTVEDFPEVIKGCTADESLGFVEHIFEKDKKYQSKFKYSDYKGRNKEDKVISFAMFQLENEEWLPCKSAILHRGNRIKPSEAYMPGCRSRGLLPEINKGQMDNEHWEKMADMYKNLGVQEDWPVEKDLYHKWMRNLAEEANNGQGGLHWNTEKERSPIAQSAEVLFEKYMRKCGEPLERTPVPFLYWTEQGEFLGFAPADSLFWADKAYFDRPEVRRKILALEDIKVFFLFLKEGEKAHLPRLSDKLNLLPDLGSDEYKEESKKLQARYEKRREYLNIIAECKLPKIQIQAKKKMVLRSDGHDICPDIDYYYGDAVLSINVQKNGSKWGALANGLCEAGEIKQADFADKFENLLGYESSEDCLEKLRKHGIPEEALKRLREDSEAEIPQPPNGENPIVEPDQSTQEEGTGDNVETRNEEGESNTPGGTGSDDGRRPNPETGIPAEQWLEKELLAQKFNVDRTGKGSDYKICLNDRQVLVEIKHIGSKASAIYWSQRQIEKALECQANNEDYYIAIVWGDSKKDYRVSWFWNPLKDLVQMDRTCTWENKSEKGVPMDKGDNWDVSQLFDKQKWKKSHTYSICIRINHKDADNNGFECFLDKLKSG